jgi:hypothetical protein
VEPAPSWALCVFYNKAHLRNNKKGTRYTSRIQLV